MTIKTDYFFLMKLKSLLNVVYVQALRQHCVKHTQSCGGNPIGSGESAPFEFCSTYSQVYSSYAGLLLILTKT